MKRMFFIGLQRPNFSYGRHIQNEFCFTIRQANNRRGFDADKFRKLVTVFDSDYIEEANTAFRLAFDQLKRSQLCNRLIDSDEARELAEIGIIQGGRKSYLKTPEYATWARRNHGGPGERGRNALKHGR
jgi:hypothetical protein